MCKLFVYYFTILSYSLFLTCFMPKDWDGGQSVSCDLLLGAEKLERNTFF